MLFSYFKDKWNQWKANRERVRKEAEERAAITLWRLYHESKTMGDISRMTGLQFEAFLARLFSRMSYTEIKLTPANDQGGDLLCLSPTGVPLVVQAKRWKGTVGNEAVQELLGAMRYYGRNKGIVVTNSTFTRAAVQLAGTNSDVTLCDKQWLDEQISRFLPPNVPEFNRESFDGIVKELCELTRGMAGIKAGRTSKWGVRRDYTFIGMLASLAAAKERELTSAEVIKVGQLCVEIVESQARFLEATKKMLSR